jgi:hypothetical protein
MSSKSLEAPPPSPLAPRGSSPFAWLAWAGRLVYVRLRFLIVLAIAFLAVSQWETIRNRWDRTVRGGGVDPTRQAVSSDTEYFCPMDPGVLADWPSKCPICNMTLVRRKRGDATPLPEGVIARMQFSPYRLQLAGIRTVPVSYRPLVRSIEGPGHVQDDNPSMVVVSLFGTELAGLEPGLKALIAGRGPEPAEGVVRSIENGAEPSALVELAHPDDTSPDARLRVTILVPVADEEPFRSLPADPPAPRPGERRRVYVCPAHADVVREAAGKCPQDQQSLARRDLGANQRIRYWCPMHPSVTAETPGARCDECGGMELVPRIITYRPAGEVLAVPESAVLDTGTRKVVYVERMPGVFDGVEVALGPRCGAEYPVLRGLEAGQRVVVSGAFLVDAENRLNPSLAAAYFGAGSREAAPVTSPSSTLDDGLDPADRKRVAAQRICPVTGKRLGSMGTPVRLEVAGRVVFVCCDGCIAALEREPARFQAKLPSSNSPATKP